MTIPIDDKHTYNTFLEILIKIIIKFVQKKVD